MSKKQTLTKVPAPKNRLEQLKLLVTEDPPQLGVHDWTTERMLADSPTPLPAEIENHWRAFLQRFRRDDIIWMGPRHQSGALYDEKQFRRVSEWLRDDQLPAPFVSASCFEPNSCRRVTEEILARRFWVVSPKKDYENRIPGLIRWLREKAQLNLVAVVQKGNKHWAWFEYPGEMIGNTLIAVLHRNGCSTAIHVASHPWPIPGGPLGAPMYRLVWLGSANEG